jgi:hypothetical protein
MRIIERPEVKGGFVPCNECGVGTRSHVLEGAEYEEYEEVWEDELQEYQGRKKKEEEEEEEVIIRYRLHNEQVCMCHKCWTPKRKKAIGFLNKHKEDWVSDGPAQMHRIKKFLKSWNYYGFDNELDSKVQEDIEGVRAALKNSAGISEEE